MPDPDAEIVLGKIFERAIETKRKVGQMYLKFAELFSHVPEIEDFWKNMNLNQMAHADWLKEIKESLTEEQILSLPEVEMVLKTHSIRKLFDKHLNKEIDNLHDAYQVAHEIESSEVNDLFEILSSEFIPSGEKKSLILDSIDQYRKQIKSFPSKFQDGFEMKRIKADGSGLKLNR